MNVNLRTLIHTPPPPHVFGVDAERLVYGRLSSRRDSLERVEKATLAPGWCQLGPVGILTVDRAVLGVALSAMVGQLQRPPGKASLVVPDSWVRTLVVDVESLPRQRVEAEEVVRWRLKRVLPCRPDEVRLDYLPVGGNGRLLVSLALDRPLTIVEDSFQAAGVSLGRIEPTALALTPLLPATTTPVLLTVVRQRSLTMLLLRDGRVTLMRHKAVPAEPDREMAFAIHELTRTVDHARQQEGISGPIEVWLATDEVFADGVQRWAADADLLVVRRLAVDRARFPVGWSGDDAPLWPLLGSAWVGEA